MKFGTVENSRERTGSGALFVGGLAAILASTCCLGPLILVALGPRASTRLRVIAIKGSTKKGLRH
jgi:MerT mercuric transport protein